MLPEDIKYIVVHCSATKANMDIGLAEIDEWHRARGWSGIGYHGVIRRNGTLESGRPLDVPGAHAKGHNHESIGVCLVGGLDSNGRPENNFTEAQFETLRLIIGGFRKHFPAAEVLGHRDLPHVAKDCPCFDVREWMRSCAL